MSATAFLRHQLRGGRLLVTGGGGYNHEATTRCWGILAATLLGDNPSPADPCYADLFDRAAAPADPAAMPAVQAAVEHLSRLPALM